MYFTRFGNRGLGASDAGDAFRNGRGFRIIHPRPGGSAAVKTKQSVALVSGYPDARDRRATRRAMTGDGTNAMRSVRVVSRRRRRAARTTRGGTETRDAIGIGRRSYQGCISVENHPKKNLPLGAGRGSRARVAHRVREEKRARMTDSE